jgi:ArsR family transcriptional regulator
VKLNLDQIVKISNALANDSRFKILQSISSNPKISCTEVIKALDITQPAVSHHLKILNDAGLIEINRKGQYGLCSLNNAVLEDYLKSIQKIFLKK